MIGEGVVYTDIARTDLATVDGFATLGVATVHESQGQIGCLDPHLRPIYPDAHIAGTAVTVSVPPGDNWMLHVAVEQCQEGDVLVVAPTSRSEAGYLGELLATSLQVRGVRGAVIDAGVRDVAELRRMGFPVWSRCVSAIGTVKEVVGNVNVPLVCAGQLIHAGDVVVADDDGVVVVRRERATDVLARARERDEHERALRERYRAGELGLDVNKMRGRLHAAGLHWLPQ